MKYTEVEYQAVVLKREFAVDPNMDIEAELRKRVQKMIDGEVEKAGPGAEVKVTGPFQMNAVADFVAQLTRASTMAVIWKADGTAHEVECSDFNRSTSTGIQLSQVWRELNADYDHATRKLE